MSAWLGVRGAGGIVSHESALELFELSDVIPTAVHISLPREKRGQRPRPGVRFHTLKRAVDRSDVRTAHGIAVTSPERSIVDSLEAGTQPEQIEMAIRQALDQGLTTPRRLRAAAEDRSARVRGNIERALGAVAV